jgi:hypothetical protein
MSTNILNKYNKSGDKNMKSDNPMIIPISMDVVDSFLNYYKENEDQVDKDQYTHFLMFNSEVHNSAMADELPGTQFKHGNILWHKAGVPPHVDICGMGNTHSLIIPLEVEKEDQKLIVFDQTYDEECTWFGDLDAEMNPDRSYGSEKNEAMYKTPGVQGLTNEECPSELTDHLPTYYGEDMWFGMSGVALDYKVGTCIIFPSNKIHTTGNMTSEKIAVTSFIVYDDV